jgi:hypothetical protein
MISDDLRRQADYLHEIPKLAKTVGRPQVDRQQSAKEDVAH